MARSDLIVNLVRAGVQGNTDEIRASAEAIAADERSKKHSGVADRIIRVLETTSPRMTGAHEQRPGVRIRDGAGGILRKEPNRALSELFLADAVRSACDEVIEEQRRADVLRAHGLEPRHRFLLVGPPGNGKTSLAEAIAYELALPLFVVRYDAVVTSYLGETAQRLRRLFDYVRSEPCVLFFDEFDAIGKERGDLHESGEIKRVVTTLLLQMDDLPTYTVLVAASNHPELLDRATWRRFELRLQIADPSRELMIDFFKDRLSLFSEATGYTARRLFECVMPRNFSEADDFFLDVRRRHALSAGQRTLRTIIDDRVRAWRQRREMLGEELSDDRPSDPSIP